MKSTKILKLFVIYIIFFSSLLLGLFFNEDFAGGAKIDFELHKLAVNSFLNDFNFYFLNYQNLENSHSPFFIIFLLFLIENNETSGRILYLFLSSLISFVFYFTLRIKYKINFIILFLISNFLLLSPYYRSTAIWPGDETISLVFFCLSIFCYFKYKLNSKNFLSFRYLFLNVFFLALSSYFRPIYCFFTLFYAYEFLKQNDKSVTLYYILANIILSFPAIYYIFFLKVNFFKNSVINFNVVNSLTLTYMTIFFYLSPFLLININKIKSFSFKNRDILITFLASIIVFLFFNYDLSSGGGFYYYLSVFLFDNNLLLLTIFPIAFYICNVFLDIYKIQNFILFVILVLLEIDGQFYIETYDPLLLILIFTLFDINLKDKFFKSSSRKNVAVLFIFMIFVLSLKIFQNYSNLNI